MNKTERFFEKMKNSKVAFIGIGVSHTDLRVEFYSKAKYFSNRSADYQLAELFDAPGIMNEYIARLAFNLLSKVKTAKLVTDDNWRELKQLQLLLENVNSNDPINELVNSVSQVCEIYAKN